MTIGTESRPIRRRLARLATIGAITALTACGGPDQSKDKPAITDPNDLVQGLTVIFERGTGHKVKQAAALRGQMIFISVVSDESGRLTLEGEESVKQLVKAGEISTVVMDAAEEGEFDLSLRNDGSSVVLATVTVTS